MSLNDECFKEATRAQTITRYVKMHYIWAKEKTRPVWSPFTTVVNDTVDATNKHPLSVSISKLGMPGIFQYAFAGLFAVSLASWVRGRPIAAAFRRYQSSHTNAERNFYARKLGMNVRDRAFPHVFAARKSRDVYAPFYYLVPSFAGLLGLFGVYLFNGADNSPNRRIALYRQAYFNAMTLEQYEAHCKKRDMEALAKIDAKMSF